ncbi:shikimate kinase [Lapidilactobacillus luobeiensis]|uniref:shikimate kinase n=1 Tax=Lapidilactobacillus luobeiensis TaxID=2950371 RepID=UPI0021C47121|nr:shikimate kinase [Lapidilactobacillus luobeiensis]
MTLILIGFMGVGKSTVAHALAQRYQLSAVDLDQVISQTYGPIEKIFDRAGEAEFRRLEYQTLARCLQGQGSPDVLALGGGIVETPASQQLLRRQAQVLWLNGSFELSWQRIDHAAGRPLVATLTRNGLLQRFEQRQQLYADVATDQLALNEPVPPPAELAATIYQHFFDLS